MSSMSSLRLVERAASFALRAWRFRSHWIDTSEGPVHVLVRNRRSSPEADTLAPPLVFVHGLVASGADYFPLLRRLAAHDYPIVAPDLPGHGLSPVPARGMRPGVLLTALRETLQAVLDEPAVVFGNSMGGFAAVRLALDAPELVSGLFLASPGGAPVPEPSLTRFLDRFRIDDETAARRFVHDMQARPSVIPRVVAWGVMERFSRPEIRELLSGIEPKDLLRPDELAALQQPIVVIWGRKERILTPVQREFFRRHLPRHAAFEEPANLGHAPFLDDPSLVVRRFLTFVHEVASGRPPS